MHSGRVRYYSTDCARGVFGLGDGIRVLYAGKRGGAVGERGVDGDNGF